MTKILLGIGTFQVIAQLFVTALKLSGWVPPPAKPLESKIVFGVVAFTFDSAMVYVIGKAWGFWT